MWNKRFAALSVLTLIRLFGSMAWSNLIFLQSQLFFKLGSIKVAPNFQVMEECQKNHKVFQGSIFSCHITGQIKRYISGKFATLESTHWPFLTMTKWEHLNTVEKSLQLSAQFMNLPFYIMHKLRSWYTLHIVQYI